MLEATAKQETKAQADGLVLQVRDLTVHYQTPLGPVKAVEGISFDLHEGERLGLVGESGSGKSTTAFALMRLIKPPGQIVDGSVMYRGRELLGATPEEMRKIRFADIALIPQGAMNSLNPVMRIKEQLFDTIRAHETGTSGSELSDRVTELLASVDLAANTANLFPHELSGGMKQRVCIAMATALKPKIILADEPTSALDVVVQRQVFETLARVQEELGAAVILVGHDMGLMAQFANRISVMYGGRIVEVSPVEDLFRDPLHPYTNELVRSLPSLDRRQRLRAFRACRHRSLDRLPAACFTLVAPKSWSGVPQISPCYAKLVRAGIQPAIYTGRGQRDSSPRGPQRH